MPTTPLQVSPQESGPSVEEHSHHDSSECKIPVSALGKIVGNRVVYLCVADTVMAAASGANDEAEASQDDCMGPPSVAGTSAEASQANEQSETEGEDGVGEHISLFLSPIFSL